MIRAARHAMAGAWPVPPADRVELDFDSRHRRRIRIVTEAGEAVLLDLPEAVAMADGDGLRLEDGRWIAIVAADEPLMEVSADSRLDLLRIAWHVGNRHLPTDISRSGDGGLRLRLRPDHVIAEMIAGLGGRVRDIRAPFQPEGGAYRGHSHHHGHHDHAAE